MEKIGETQAIQEHGSIREKAKHVRRVIVSIIIVIVILVAGISMYVFFQKIEEEKKQGTEIITITYKELCDDFDSNTWSFKSYKNGDIIYIQDNISSVNCTDTLLGTYTNITFSSVTPTNDTSLIPPLMIRLPENRTQEYLVGEPVEIPVHVKIYTIETQTMTILQEWYVSFLCEYYNKTLPLPLTIHSGYGLGGDWHVSINQERSKLLNPEDVGWYVLDENNATIDYGGIYITNESGMSYGPFCGAMGKVNVTWNDNDYDKTFASISVSDSFTVETSLTEGIFRLKYKPTNATIAETHLHPYTERYVDSEYIGGKYNASIEHWQFYQPSVDRWIDIYKVVYTKNGKEYNSSLSWYIKDALDWVKNNTDENATILSWWDYGHTIRGYSGREPIVDAPSLEIKDTLSAPEEWEEWGSNEKIVDVSNALTGTPEDATPIMKKYNATYVLVDARMFPFSWSNTGIFYAPVSGANKNLNDFFETLIIGEELDEEGERIMITGWMTQEEFEEWCSECPAGHVRCASDYRLEYKQAFYDSMFYKGYIGYSGKDIGSDGIPGLSPALAQYPPMPCWMQKHFRLVYINSGCRISAYYKGAYVNGTIVTEGGVAVPNVYVTVFDDFGIPHDMMSTNETGCYSLRAPFGLKENDYNVTIIASSGNLNAFYKIGDKTLEQKTLHIKESDAFSGKEVSLNFTIEGASLYGKVSWDDDTPVANATIILRMDNITFTTNSTEDGNYSFDDIAPGTYELTINITGHERCISCFPLVSNESRIQNICLMPSAIYGYVYNESGVALPNVTVFLLDNITGKWINTTTNESGAYEFDKLLWGDYVVKIEEEGYTAYTYGVNLSMGDRQYIEITLSEV